MKRGVSGRLLDARLAVAALVLVFILAAGVALRAGWLPWRISDVWPLQLEKPGGWLLDRQLADLRRSPDLCRRALAAPGIVASPVADNFGPAGCGWQNAVRIAAAGGARLEVAAASCELSAALALWVAHVVQPAAGRHFGRKVVGIDHLGAYACRNMRGSPALAGDVSEHASANALDVKSFRLADGRRIAVAPGWGTATADGRFLAEVHKGACAYFRVVLGPAYNAAHRDHFHFDRGAWRGCH